MVRGSATRSGAASVATGPSRTSTWTPWVPRASTTQADPNRARRSLKATSTACISPDAARHGGRRTPRRFSLPQMPAPPLPPHPRRPWQPPPGSLHARCRPPSIGARYRHPERRTGAAHGQGEKSVSDGPAIATGRACGRRDQPLCRLFRRDRLFSSHGSSIFALGKPTLRPSLIRAASRSRQTLVSPASLPASRAKERVQPAAPGWARHAWPTVTPFRPPRACT